MNKIRQELYSKSNFSVSVVVSVKDINNNNYDNIYKMNNNYVVLESRGKKYIEIKYFGKNDNYKVSLGFRELYYFIRILRIMKKAFESDDVFVYDSLNALITNDKVVKKSYDLTVISFTNKINIFPAVEEIDNTSTEVIKIVSDDRHIETFNELEIEEMLEKLEKADIDSLCSILELKAMMYTDRIKFNKFIDEYRRDISDLKKLINK